EILRGHPNRTKREEAVVGTNSRWPFDGYVGHEPAVSSNFHLRPNHAIRSNLAAGMNFCARIDDRCGVNCHFERCQCALHGSAAAPPADEVRARARSTKRQLTVASAARLSST